jgi:hypothetical protein
MNNGGIAKDNALIAGVGRIFCAGDFQRSAMFQYY